MNNRYINGLIIILFWLLNTAALFASGKQDLPVFVYQDRVGDASAMITAAKLKDEGLFSVKRFSSGSLCAEALISGTADVATMGDSVAVKLVSRYPDKIVLLGVHGEGPRRHKLVSSSMEPKKIAVKFGTSTHAALQAWYEEQGVDLNSPGAPVLIDMSPSLQISALAAGEVDALAASEPTPSIAVNKIYLSQGRDLEVTALESFGKSYPLLLVTTRKALADYEKQIAILKDALVLSAGRVLSELDFLSGITGLEKGLLEDILLFHSYGYSSVHQYKDELENLAEFLIAQGIINEIPEWSEVITEQFLY